MRIGELAAQTGASVRALRYYEEQGLLSPQRTASAQRVYVADSVERVRLLRRLYNAGLTSKTIASLLPCVDTPSAAVTRETMDVMRREHARISAQIAELTTTRDDLIYLIDAAVAFHRDQLAADATAASAAVTVQPALAALEEGSERALPSRSSSGHQAPVVLAPDAVGLVGGCTQNDVGVHC